MRLWFVCVLAIKVVFINATTPTPVVLWHGMGDTCCIAFSMGGIKLLIEKVIPGTYVLSLKIGNNTIEDLESGYFMNPNEQVNLVCQMLSADEKLKNGFNVIGFSQGSQFLRAVVQRCGHKLPPIKNLISIGGQHQGVYGLPHCFAVERRSCDYIREVLNYAAYAKWVQESVVQATYWHDPLNEKLYRDNSIFLSDINNEVNINKTYIENLNKLKRFVMVKFNNDSIVQPKETEWFGFYEEGQAKKLLPLRKSKIYTEDRLGLKQMDKAGKLEFLSNNGDHLHMTGEWFVDMIIKPYLYDDEDIEEIES